MDTIYLDLLEHKEVRSNLSALRAKLRAGTEEAYNKEHVSTFVQEHEAFVLDLLAEEDAKTRKNAALLLGDISYQNGAQALYDAYEKENTLFVKSAYLDALSQMDIADKLPQIKQQEFKKAFTAEFGNIASDHSWGFGAVEIPTLGQATTKVAAPNSNQWFDPNQNYKLVKPEYITDHEIQVVSKWFKDHKNPVSTPVNLTDFFVLQVYNENEQTYTGTDNNGATHTVTPAGHMDYICVEENGTEAHIYNLNSNTPAFKAENNTGSFPTTGIQYMQNSSTAKWGFKDSYGDENTVKWDFVICAIEVDGKVGYYVG